MIERSHSVDIIVLEARAAASRLYNDVNGCLVIPEERSNTFLGELNTSEFSLFMRTFSAELLRIKADSQRGRNAD